MGQKVNPINLRIPVEKNWKSRWFAQGKDYKKFLKEDLQLRKVLDENFASSGVASIEIERLPKEIKIYLRVARPGLVIGRGGVGIEEARKIILKTLGLNPKSPNLPKIDIPVEQVKSPETSAKLVAERIAFELERRLPHRRVVTKTIERVLGAGAKGVKISLSGRIGGAEISRTENYHRGSVPAQTLRAKIDYAHYPALLKRGYVGIKVWIYNKE